MAPPEKVRGVTQADRAGPGLGWWGMQGLGEMQYQLIGVSFQHTKLEICSQHCSSCASITLTLNLVPCSQRRRRSRRRTCCQPTPSSSARAASAQAGHNPSAPGAAQLPCLRFFLLEEVSCALDVLLSHSSWGNLDGQRSQSCWGL